MWLGRRLVHPGPQGSHFWGFSLSRVFASSVSAVCGCGRGGGSKAGGPGQHGCSDGLFPACPFLELQRPHRSAFTPGPSGSPKAWKSGSAAQPLGTLHPTSPGAVTAMPCKRAAGEGPRACGSGTGNRWGLSQARLYLAVRKAVPCFPPGIT